MRGWERERTVRYYVERHMADNGFYIVDAWDSEEDGWEAIDFYRQANPQCLWRLVRVETIETVLERS